LYLANLQRMKFFTFCSSVLFVVIVSNVQTQNNSTVSIEDSFETEVYGPYEIDDLDYEVPVIDDYTADDYIDWTPFPGKIFMCFYQTLF
jgi:hypothetical protein